MTFVWPPRSFLGQTLATTIAVLFLSQLVTLLLLGLFVIDPQVKRVAGIVAQTVAAVSDAADLSDPVARRAIIARLDASPYIDVWPGSTPPPPTGPPPRMLERYFLQAFVDALADRGPLEWRTDPQRRLWMQVTIGKQPYWISAGSPAALHPLTAIEVSGAAAFLLSLVAVVALQRRIMRPLEDLTAAVRSVGPHVPAQPVRESGPDELVALSRGFNAMIRRLAEADEERAFLLAGVSHDLRTPLAKLGLAVEILAPGDAPLVRATHAYVAELDRILSQFLVFARGFESEPEVAFDVDALISEVAAMRAVEGHAFRVAGERIGILSGRPEALRRALLNLTDNATKYGAPDFTIGAQRGVGCVDLFVRDMGAGAPEGQLASLARPFVRSEAHADLKTGTGLGLAIVDRVARLHGGALLMSNLAPHGFEARVRIARVASAGTAPR